jgi:hypothetical protein
MASEPKKRKTPYPPSILKRVKNPYIGMGQDPRPEGTYVSGMPYYEAQAKGIKGNPKARGRHGDSNERQKKAVDTLLAKPDQAQGKTLQEVGYTKLTANQHPRSVTGSRGFLEYLEKRVPDDKLADLISAGMQAEKPPAGFEDFVPDWGNRFKFVELVTRLKGYGKVDAPTVNVQFTNAIPRPEPIEGEVVENN